MQTKLIILAGMLVASQAPAQVKMTPDQAPVERGVIIETPADLIKHCDSKPDGKERVDCYKVLIEKLQKRPSKVTVTNVPLERLKRQKNYQTEFAYFGIGNLRETCGGLTGNANSPDRQLIYKRKFEGEKVKLAEAACFANGLKYIRDNDYERIDDNHDAKMLAGLVRAMCSGVNDLVLKAQCYLMATSQPLTGTYGIAVTCNAVDRDSNAYTVGDEKDTVACVEAGLAHVEKNGPTRDDEAILWALAKDVCVKFRRELVRRDCYDNSRLSTFSRREIRTGCAQFRGNIEKYGECLSNSYDISAGCYKMAASKHSIEKEFRLYDLAWLQCFVDGFAAKYPGSDTERAGPGKTR
jgi:hypothetical protein